MVFGAGKVLEERTESRRRLNHKINLKPTGQYQAGCFVPCFKYPGLFGVIGEMGYHGGSVVRGDGNIHVSYR